MPKTMGETPMKYDRTLPMNSWSVAVKWMQWRRISRSVMAMDIRDETGWNCWTRLGTKQKYPNLFAAKLIQVSQLLFGMRLFHTFPSLRSIFGCHFQIDLAGVILKAREPLKVHRGSWMSSKQGQTSIYIQGYVTKLPLASLFCKVCDASESHKSCNGG